MAVCSASANYIDISELRVISMVISQKLGLEQSIRSKVSGWNPGVMLSLLTFPWLLLEAFFKGFLKFSLGPVEM